MKISFNAVKALKDTKLSESLIKEESVLIIL